MKVYPVSSLGFKSKNIKDRKDANSYYLYSASDTDLKPQNKRFGLIAGFLALSAVCATLYNIKHGKKLPKNIVELSDMKKGLNKINGFFKTTTDLKSNVIYPLKCAACGEKKVKNFKNGLILINENDEATEKMMKAFLEHIDELDIDTVTIKRYTYKKNEEGHQTIKKLKRNEIVKEVFSQVEKAEEKYNSTGKYTVINLGNLEELTDLKAVKSQKSNIEQLLEDISSNKYKGVLWCAKSTNQEALPLFFYNLPVFITKLVD